MWPDPRDLVAIILAVGVVLVLLAKTEWAILLMGASDVVEMRNAASADRLVAWKDVINVLIGSLAGYIAGKKSDR